MQEIKQKYGDLDLKQSDNIKILEEEINNYKMKIAEHERRESELES